MAAEVEHSCPNCPSTESAEMLPCDSIVKANCAPEDQLSAEPRGLQVKAKDLPGDSLIPFAAGLYESARPVFLVQPLPDSFVFSDPGGPSRNVLFCVYLK
jgi:hypothetical protein